LSRVAVSCARVLRSIHREYRVSSPACRDSAYPTGEAEGAPLRRSLPSARDLGVDFLFLLRPWCSTLLPPHHSLLAGKQLDPDTVGKFSDVGSSELSNCAGVSTNVQRKAPESFDPRRSIMISVTHRLPRSNMYLVIWSFYTRIAFHFFLAPNDRGDTLRLRS